jgi:hypothetical protein
MKRRHQHIRFNPLSTRFSVGQSIREGRSIFTGYVNDVPQVVAQTHRGGLDALMRRHALMRA